MIDGRRYRGRPTSGGLKTLPGHSLILRFAPRASAAETVLFSSNLTTSAYRFPAFSVPSFMPGQRERGAAEFAELRV